VAGGSGKDEALADLVETLGGQRVSAGMVAHSPLGFSEWGRQLDEWRAQGIGLWAAIERPEGRVVDVLLDHGMRVSPQSQGRGPGAGTWRANALLERQTRPWSPQDLELPRFGGR
jgi:hypothetical protein